MQAKARCPVRFMDIGGWTDVKPSIDALPHGGATLNMAIVPLNGDGKPRFVEAHHFSSGYSNMASGPGFNNFSVHDIGGLGTSAALNVALCAVATVPEHRGKLGSTWRKRIADMAFRMGNEIWGILGGKQDEYAAAIGGTNLFLFRQDGTVVVRRVPVKQSVLEVLQQQILLFDTGKSRLSGRIHKHVWGNMERSLPIMKALVRLAHRARRALITGDIEELGFIMNQSCELQFALHRSVADPRIREPLDILRRAGILIGGRPCGAGGGGAVTFLVRDGEIHRAIEILSSLDYGKVIPWQFDFHGLHVEIS